MNVLLLREGGPKEPGARCDWWDNQGELRDRLLGMRQEAPENGFQSGKEDSGHFTGGNLRDRRGCGDKPDRGAGDQPGADLPAEPDPEKGI